MSNDSIRSSSDITTRIIMLLGISGFQQLGYLLKTIKKLIRGFSHEGVYEVLDYETVLELKDERGEKAVVKKREKVRYLQNNIYAFQDQAWGDGRILIDYRCSPGTPVDCYRVGYKNIILISLREVKNIGDIDEFNIDWKIKRGFLSSTGFWATEISHRTKQIKVHIIFPRTRPPMKVILIEKNRQKNIKLGKDYVKKLPDGNWEVSWERSQPRLYEQYLLNWEW